MHFDCVNGFLNSIKEIIWQTEAVYRCPLNVNKGLVPKYFNSKINILRTKKKTKQNKLKQKNKKTH